MTLGLKYHPKTQEIDEAEVVEVAVVEAQRPKMIEEIVQLEEPLSRAKSEMALAVTTCAEAVAFEFARSKSYRVVATPQTA